MGRVREWRLSRGNRLPDSLRSSGLRLPLINVPLNENCCNFGRERTTYADSGKNGANSAGKGA